MSRPWPGRAASRTWPPPRPSSTSARGPRHGRQHRLCLRHQRDRPGAGPGRRPAPATWCWHGGSPEAASRRSTGTGTASCWARGRSSSCWRPPPTPTPGAHSPRPCSPGFGASRDAHHVTARTRRVTAPPAPGAPPSPRGPGVRGRRPRQRAPPHASAGSTTAAGRTGVASATAAGTPQGRGGRGRRPGGRIRGAGASVPRLWAGHRPRAPPAPGVRHGRACPAGHGQGLRATPTYTGCSRTTRIPGSGCQFVAATTPGPHSSRPSKNRVTSACERARTCVPPER